MLPFGSRNVADYPRPADTIAAAVVAVAGTAVAADWPTGAEIFRFTPHALSYLNVYSTNVAVPATASSGTSVSSGLNIAFQPQVDRIMAVPGGSTGFSYVSTSTGVGSMEFWGR